MPDSYLCPTCDNEVIVGKSCAICSRNIHSRKKKRISSNSKKSKPKPKDWEQDEVYDGLDLPDEKFDYDKFIENEFGNTDRSPHQRIGIAWYWWLVALILCIVWIFSFI